MRLNKKPLTCLKLGVMVMTLLTSCASYSEQITYVQAI